MSQQTYNDPFTFTEEDYLRFDTLGIDANGLLGDGYSPEQIVEFSGIISDEQQLPPAPEPIQQLDSPAVQPVAQSVGSTLPSLGPVVQPVQVEQPSGGRLDSNVTLSDLGNLAGSAVNQALTGPGFIIEQAGKYFGYPTIELYGRAMQNTLDQNSQWYEDRMTPEGLADSRREYIHEDPTTGEYSLGNFNLGTVASTVASGAGSTVPSLVSGAALTKAISTVAKKAAKNYPRFVGALGFSTAASLIEGSGTAKDVHDIIMENDLSVVKQSPLFKSLDIEIQKQYPDSHPDQRATYVRSMIANQASFDSGILSGTIIGVTSIPFGAFLGRLGLGKGKVSRETIKGAFFKGMTLEGAQEFTQEYGQRVVTNFGRFLGGEKVPPLQGAANAGVQGGIGGGGIGGVVGATASTIPSDIETPSLEDIANTEVDEEFAGKPETPTDDNQEETKTPEEGTKAETLEEEEEEGDAVDPNDEDADVPPFEDEDDQSTQLEDPAQFEDTEQDPDRSVTDAVFDKLKKTREAATDDNQEVTDAIEATLTKEETIDEEVPLSEAEEEGTEAEAEKAEEETIDGITISEPDPKFSELYKAEREARKAYQKANEAFQDDYSENSLGDVEYFDEELYEKTEAAKKAWKEAEQAATDYVLAKRRGATEDTTDAVDPTEVTAESVNTPEKEEKVVAEVKAKVAQKVQALEKKKSDKSVPKEEIKEDAEKVKKLKKEYVSIKKDGKVTKDKLIAFANKLRKPERVAPNTGKVVTKEEEAPKAEPVASIPKTNEEAPKDEAVASITKTNKGKNDKKYTVTEGNNEYVVNDKDKAKELVALIKDDPNVSHEVRKKQTKAINTTSLRRKQQLGGEVARDKSSGEIKGLANALISAASEDERKEVEVVFKERGKGLKDLAKISKERVKFFEDELANAKGEKAKAKAQAKLDRIKQIHQSLAEFVSTQGGKIKVRGEQRDQFDGFSEFLSTYSLEDMLGSSYNPSYPSEGLLAATNKKLRAKGLKEITYKEGESAESLGKKIWNRESSEFRRLIRESNKDNAYSKEQYGLDPLLEEAEAAAKRGDTKAIAKVIEKLDLIRLNANLKPTGINTENQRRVANLIDKYDNDPAKFALEIGLSKLKKVAKGLGIKTAKGASGVDIAQEIFNFNTREGQGGIDFKVVNSRKAEQAKRTYVRGMTNLLNWFNKRLAKVEAGTAVDENKKKITSKSAKSKEVTRMIDRVINGIPEHVEDGKTVRQQKGVQQIKSELVDKLKGTNIDPSEIIGEYKLDDKTDNERLIKAIKKKRTTRYTLGQAVGGKEQQVGRTDSYSMPEDEAAIQIEASKGGQSLRAVDEDDTFRSGAREEQAEQDVIDAIGYDPRLSDAENFNNSVQNAIDILGNKVRMTRIDPTKPWTHEAGFTLEDIVVDRDKVSVGNLRFAEEGDTDIKYVDVPEGMSQYDMLNRIGRFTGESASERLERGRREQRGLPRPKRIVAMVPFIPTDLSVNSDNSVNLGFSNIVFTHEKFEGSSFIYISKRLGQTPDKTVSQRVLKGEKADPAKVRFEEIPLAEVVVTKRSGEPLDVQYSLIERNIKRDNRTIISKMKLSPKAVSIADVEAAIAVAVNEAATTRKKKKTTSRVQKSDLPVSVVSTNITPMLGRLLTEEESIGGIKDAEEKFAYSNEESDRFKKLMAEHINMDSLTIDVDELTKGTKLTKKERAEYMAMPLPSDKSMGKLSDADMKKYEDFYLSKAEMIATGKRQQPKTKIKPCKVK